MAKTTAMKTLLLLLFPILLFVQDCDYLKNETDEFTGQRTIATKSLTIAPGVQASFMRVGKLTAMNIAVTDLGCVSSDSYVILLYTDSTTQQIDHAIGVACDSPVFMGLIGQGKKVAKIRIHFTTTKDVVIDDQDFLIDGLKCIE